MTPTIDSYIIKQVVQVPDFDQLEMVGCERNQRESNENETKKPTSFKKFF